MSITRLAPAFALVLALGACDTTGGTKQTLGTIGGGAAGALLGSQFGHGTGKLAMVGLGALGGALLGGSIGKSLDSADRNAAQHAEERAYQAPIGETINWNNPQSGNRGTITPTRDGYSSGGSYCREFEQSIFVGGQQEHAYGTACRQPDGSWKIVSE